MNKTKLVLFPVLAALLLAGCTTTKKSSKKKKSSSGAITSKTTSQGGGGSSSGGGGGGGSSSGGGGGGTSIAPVPAGEATFDLTPGAHVTTLDFMTNSAAYKNEFPRVEATTGLYDVTLGGLSCNGVGCYCGSYSNIGYLFMKNKDSFATNHGFAFIANKVSLGNIDKITLEVPTGTNPSAKAEYNIAILSSAVTAEGGSSAGTTFTGTGGTVAGSGGYFCVTQLAEGYNGQIGKLTISYTIS